MEIVIHFILFIITFLIGYILGFSVNNKETLKEIGYNIKSTVLQKNVGAIRHPTAEQLAKRGTILEETEEVMRETFKEIITSD